MSNIPAAAQFHNQSLHPATMSDVMFFLTAALAVGFVIGLIIGGTKLCQRPHMTLRRKRLFGTIIGLIGFASCLLGFRLIDVALALPIFFLVISLASFFALGIVVRLRSLDQIGDGPVR